MLSLYEWWRGKPTMTLKFYMKSGNVIVADRVTEYTITPDENGGIQRLILKQIETRGAQHLIVQSMDISQVEAVVKVA